MASQEKWCVLFPASMWRPQEKRRHIGVPGGRRLGSKIVPICNPDHPNAAWVRGKRVEAWPLCGTCVKIARRIARQAREGERRD